MHALFSRAPVRPILKSAVKRTTPAQVFKNNMSNLSLGSRIRLRSGYEIPQLGFGVYQATAADAEASVREALATGYRHIDSAVAYRNQTACGTAMRQAMKSIPRSDIFYTSKIRPKSMSYDSAKAQVDLTLEETGLDYIDLMLLHAPYGGPQNRKGAWRALVEAVEDGKVRSIGVSNYGIHHLAELEKHISELEAERGGPGKGGVISVGQWEIHPWMPRRDIVEWCQDRNVAIEAFCPIVRGQRFDDETLQALAKKVRKTPAQILLRWSLQKGYIPLPKSVTPSRIHENAALFDFDLSLDDMTELETDQYAPCAWDPTVEPLSK